MILIRNAKIIDGTGAPERHGDILISGNAISAIGNFPHKKTEVTIDALGQRLIPGCISIHPQAGYEATLFTDHAPTTQREGYTTLIGGADGTSIAPLCNGSLEAFRKWGGTSGINIGWRSMAEFRRAFNYAPRTINFGTFAGYNTVRRAILHEMDGDPTDKEQKVIVHILEEAIIEGALGVAINLDTAHGQGISHEEVRHVALLAARYGVPLALKPRAWGKHFMESANEIVALYRATGARIILIDFLPRELNKAEEKDFRQAYTVIQDAGDGLFMEIQYGPDQHMPIYELLPRFARTGTIHSMRMLLEDKSQRKKIIANLPRLEGARIIHTPREYKALINVSLEDFAQNRGVTGKEAILELMRITQLKATIAIPQKPSALHTELIRNARVLPSGPLQSVYKAVDDALLPLETATMKLTGLPATVLNLTKRGMLSENYAADLVLIDDRATVIRTIINGSINGIKGICVNK